jgi:hypothetical protein
MDAFDDIEDEETRRRMKLGLAEAEAGALSSRLREADAQLGTIPDDIGGGVSVDIGMPQLLSRTPADEPAAQPSRTELSGGGELYAPDETQRMRAKYGDDFSNWPAGPREWGAEDEMSSEELDAAIAQKGRSPGPSGGPLGALTAAMPGAAGVPQRKPQPRPAPRAPVGDIEDPTIAGVVEGMGRAAERATQPPAPAPAPSLAEKLPIPGMPPEQAEAVYKYATEQAKPQRQGPSEAEQLREALRLARSDAEKSAQFGRLGRHLSRAADIATGTRTDASAFDSTGEAGGMAARNLEKQMQEAESYAKAVATGQEREWRQKMEVEKLALAKEKAKPQVDPLLDEKRAKLQAEVDRLRRPKAGMDPMEQKRRELQLKLMEKKLNEEKGPGHGSEVAQVRREQLQYQKERNQERDVEQLSGITGKMDAGGVLSVLKDMERIAPGVTLGKQPKSIPGFTRQERIGRGMPWGSGDWLVSEGGKAMQQHVENLRDMLLRARSGAAITESEYTRLSRIVGGVDLFESPQRLAQGLANFRKAFGETLRDKQIGFKDNLADFEGTKYTDFLPDRAGELSNVRSRMPQAAPGSMDAPGRHAGHAEAEKVVGGKRYVKRGGKWFEA